MPVWIAYLAIMVSCAASTRVAEADERVDHTEVPAPSGQRVAIMDGYRSNGLLAASGGFYDVLTIKEGDRSATVDWLPVGSNPAWLSDNRRRVTLDRMGEPSVPSSVLGVEIVLHLGDRVHVESVRKELEGYEEHDYKCRFAGPNNRSRCGLQHRNWENARFFWAWARQAADNGNSDPGPWVNKYYPTDCSSLTGR